MLRFCAEVSCRKLWEMCADQYGTWVASPWSPMIRTAGWHEAQHTVCVFTNMGVQVYLPCRFRCSPPAYQDARSSPASCWRRGNGTPAGRHTITHLVGKWNMISLTFLISNRTAHLPCDHPPFLPRDQENHIWIRASRARAVIHVVMKVSPSSVLPTETLLLLQLISWYYFHMAAPPSDIASV